MQISGWLSRLKDRSRAKSRARRERVVSPQNWMGDRRLRIRSAHGRDRNDAATSPTLALVRQQVLDPEMPNFTVPGNELSDLLFTGNGTVGNVPTKTITLYNNTDQTIYPFLYDANNGFAGGPYDPFDAHAQEYRLYVGYQSEGTNYLGLQAQSSISFAVPLVFWDSGRISIATDGSNLLPTTNGQVNTKTNKNTQNVENPFHFEFYNLDNTPTQIVTVGGITVTNLQTNTESSIGVLMYYHCSDTPGEDPGLDSPIQLIEFTIRDKDFLQKVNDYDQATFGTPIDSGQIITLINYDVSFVDHLLLPVAMQANQVPVIDAVTNSVLATPDFGWIGAANSYLGDTNPPSLQAVVTSFTGNTSVNGLGTYFDGLGWPSFFNPNYSASNPTAGIRIPGGANIFFDSPLADVMSSYNLPFGPLNHWMLSSGGSRPIQYSEAGVLSQDLQTITDGGDGTFLSQLTSGTWLVTTNEHLDKANPNGTVESVDPDHPPGQKTITLKQPATGGLTPGKPYSFIYFTPITDPVATGMRAIWYSWANYYAGLYSNFADEYLTATVKADTDSKPGVSDTRILNFDQAPLPALAVGMQLTKANGEGIPSGTLITILKISADQKTVYLSQPAPGVSDGQTNVPFTFSKPPAISTFGDNVTGIFNIDNTKFGDFPGGIEGANQFAGNVYEVMSVFSTINPRKVPLLPGSMELIGNSIGGNVGFLPTANYPDGKGGIVALKNISADVRDTLKSALRGVPDFTQFPETQWYPNPATATGGQTYNIFNLDPYVWFVHVNAGLSGYGFSFDDDAADVGANSTSTLSVAVGGLNKLPNPEEWFPSTPYGTVSSQATIRLGTAADGNMPDGTPWLGNSLLTVQDQVVFYEVKPTDAANSLDGAYVSSSTGNLSKGTQIILHGPDMKKQEFLLSGNPAATSTPFTVTFTGKP